MIRHNHLMGTLIVLLCGMLLSRDRWFLENTRKGQRLVEWFGPNSALWVLRFLTVGGIVFGGLLAVGIIRPIQW